MAAGGMEEVSEFEAEGVEEVGELAERGLGR